MMESRPSQFPGEALIQAPFDQGEVGMCQMMADGVLLRVNRRFCDIVRAREQNCLGGAFSGWIHPDDRPVCAGMLATIATGRQPSSGRAIRLDMGNAPSAWVQLTLIAVCDAEGALQHILGVLKDITEFKMAEDAFRRQHALFSRIMRHSPVGLIHLEPDGVIGMSNPEAARILGLPGDGAEGDQTAFSVIRWQAEHAGVPVEMDLPLRPESFPEPGAYRVFLPDGRERLVSVRISQVEKDEDLLEGAVLVLEDVTDRIRSEHERDRLHRELKQAVQQLERSNRQLQELLHEKMESAGVPDPKHREVPEACASAHFPVPAEVV